MPTSTKTATPPAGASRPGRRRGGAPALLLAAVLAAACAPSVDNNGNLPLREAIDNIQPGRTTRQEVTRLLGSPSAQSTFAKDQVWYYIGKRTETFAFFNPEVLEHKVVEVRFDERGIVRSVERIDATKARKVQIVDRVTPTAGKELTILEQLIGNIGRFSAEDAMRQR